MSKERKLRDKYFQALKEKENADKVFQKALNDYFIYLNGKTVGPAIAYASTFKG